MDDQVTAPFTDQRTRDMASALRFLTVDAVETAQSGHPGMPLGMADVATVLFDRFLKYDAAEPEWPDRDRFVLSVGHGSMLLYGLLWLTGSPDLTLQDLKDFRKLGSKTAGHPEYEELRGVEATTGPLGQGVANAVGMALAERLQAQQLGADVVDHRTYVMAGDGCLMEGVAQEAIAFAGHMRLGKLTLLFDDNSVTIDGFIDHASSEGQQARFEAAGWHVQSIGGHDEEAIAEALTRAQEDPRPSMIACKTVIGRGAPTNEGKPAAHFGAVGAQDRRVMQEVFDWPHEAFTIPAEVKRSWEEAGSRGAAARQEWLGRLSALSPVRRREFDRRMAGELPADTARALEALKSSALDGAAAPTRDATKLVLKALHGDLEELVGGSADLAGSTHTWPEGVSAFSAEEPSGRYIPYGIREHAMVSITNGIALHGGFIPYCGTFLCFVDYARPAVRLAAMMQQRAVFVFTHDCITVGEDGPTHQPVEHLAGLRATPNLHVFRPGDMIEALESWELALGEPHAPSALCLSRNPLPVLRTSAEENLTARGAYVLAEASGERQVTFFATGSELNLAMSAREDLEKRGYPTAVISTPIWSRFEAQPEAWKAEVLGRRGSLHVAIEALSSLGWERFVGRDGLVLSVDSFGASGPANMVAEHFGFSTQTIVSRVLERLAA